MSWRERAACRGTDVKVFHRGGRRNLPAILLCSACPVQRECLDDALELEEPSEQFRTGIRGGLGPHERQIEYRRRRDAHVEVEGWREIECSWRQWMRQQERNERERAAA